MSKKIKLFSGNGSSKCDGCEEAHKKLDDLKEMLQQQTQQIAKICEILAEHKVVLNQLSEKNKALDTVMKIFPIQTELQLHELEKLLESQNDLYVRFIKSQLKGDVIKNLGQVFGREIVMAFNVEGVLGKKRLKDFKNVYSAIIDSISDERPEEKFRAALHHQKKKYHKINSKQKTKENQALLSMDHHDEPNKSSTPN